MPLSLANRSLFVFVGVLFAFSATTLSIIDVALVILGISTFTHRPVLSYIYKTLHSATHRSLYIFGGLCVLSLLFLPETSKFFTLTTLYLIGLFFLIQYWHTYREALLSGYCVGGVLSALLGIVLYLFFNDIPLLQEHFFTDDMRLTMFFSDPNVFGAFLVPAYISTLIAIYTTQFRFKKGLYSIGAMILMGGLILSESRGAWLNVFITSLIACYLLWTHTAQHMHFTRTRRYWFSGVVTLSILTIGAMIFLSRFEVIPPNHSFKELPRIENMKHAYTLLKERSVIELIRGSGSGTYEHYAPDGFSAHNLYLRLLFENGLLGLMCFGGFLWYIYTKGYRHIALTSDPYTIVIIASLSGILVHSMFIDTLHFRHFWFLLALI